MTFSSRGTPEFWPWYRQLPAHIKALAQKNFQLWSANAFHPSLHFKRVGKSKWSARVGDHYRAAGKFAGNEFLWEWIGTHEEYNKRF
ncbi:MAG: hypothetical protein ABI042_07120 [Verrucomicrobiota bacterium]